MSRVQTNIIKNIHKYSIDIYSTEHFNSPHVNYPEHFITVAHSYYLLLSGDD
jgi:hypothetical protein